MSAETNGGIHQTKPSNRHVFFFFPLFSSLHPITSSRNHKQRSQSHVGVRVKPAIITAPLFFYRKLSPTPHLYIQGRAAHPYIQGRATHLYVQGGQLARIYRGGQLARTYRRGQLTRTYRGGYGDGSTRCLFLVIARKVSPTPGIYTTVAVKPALEAVLQFQACIIHYAASQSGWCRILWRSHFLVEKCTTWAFYWRHIACYLYRAHIACYLYRKL